MKSSRNLFGISILSLCFCWSGAVNASTSFPGIAVSDAGIETMVGSIGRTGSDGSPGVGQIGLTNAIKYFIPLNGEDNDPSCPEGDANYNGVYGVDAGSHPCGSAGAGTCSDYGRGSGYSDAGT
jgi:hypothetical protein